MNGDGRACYLLGMDGAHDLGGMQGFGAVVVPGSDRVYQQRWEARVFALHMLVGIQDLGGGPGGRPTREAMPAADYLAASYYQRWRDQVRVRRMRPGRHTRCPRYVRGATGRIERVHGLDAPPELAAYGEPATPEPVYAVAFDSRDLWGEDGRPPWTVLVDLWEHYLEEVPSA